MNYGMTEDAKKVKNEVNNEIIAELENGGGKFVDNMESLKGPLYNATTGTQIQDKKAIEIMTQAEGLEDQRFMTGNQAIKEGVHIHEGAKAVRAINFSAEAEKDEFGNLAKDEKGNVKGRMMGRTYKYFNAKDLDLGNKGKGEFQYKDFEKADIENNLAQRMAEMHKSRQYTYERAAKEGRTDVAEPMPLPEVEKYHGNREGFYNAVTEYAVKNTLAMGGNKDLESGEYLQGKDGKPGERKVISKTEKAARIEFRAKLGTALINREMGLSNKPFKEWVSREEGKKLAKYYKEHPEKLNHDINASVKAAANVKEKVMFLTRTRKTREQIQKMENDFHADASNQGKSIPASHYYDYAPINVQKMEERIKADPQFKDMATRNQINKALSRSMKTLDTQIKSIENEFGNTVTMSKFLEAKISETRKKMGLESDPRKYMKDYHENTPVMKQQNDGKMRIVKQTISFTADMDEIRKNNMSQEEIINKFANGKEGREGLDIVKEVKKNETEKTIAKTEAYMKNQAGKWAQENAQAKALKKADWKARMAKAAEKTNTMNMSKAKSKSHSRKNAGRDDR